AVHMSQFKAGFLARTSHELRSPLSSLIGMHQIILSDLCDSPEEARDFVAQANTSALKMVKLLDEVIAVAKTEHGTNRLDIYPLQLTQVLEDVERLTHLQAANRNLQLEIILPDSDLYVLADPRRFRQALAGIVDSAIAQMQEGSIKVWVASVPDSKEAHIWMTIQSPSPVWSEPVDLLYTKPEQQKQPGEGTELSPGLILLMAQTLIEVMHGRLELLPVSAQETTDDSADNLTRLQCSMPLGTPETVEQALVQE
ncbi:MAG TPA: HAMP domain-containing sensor histidine kinase, partial [Coleofasciculaceae cyanobacterium]